MLTYDVQSTRYAKDHLFPDLVRLLAPFTHRHDSLPLEKDTIFRLIQSSDCDCSRVKDAEQNYYQIPNCLLVPAQIIYTGCDLYEKHSILLRTDCSYWVSAIVRAGSSHLLDLFTEKHSYYLLPQDQTVWKPHNLPGKKVDLQRGNQGKARVLAFESDNTGRWHVRLQLDQHPTERSNWYALSDLARRDHEIITEEPNG
jgi:hypothetical protein